MDVEPSTSLNPLECGVCQQEFNNPVHLPCLHVFCTNCVNEGAGTKGACPECDTPIGEAPPTDLLAKYLVDSAHETSEVCANCDQIAQPMFFCETCQQALCHECRQNTHQAKMFSQHRLISLEERARVRGRVSCAQHGEPYILFCVDEKRLVCIQCFNGRPLEARHSFISIDNAHASNVEKLEKWTNRLRLFQLEKREEVDVRARMLKEVEQNFDKEKMAITQLCQHITDTVTTVRDNRISSIASEKNNLERECREQMQELNAVMTPIRLYLLSAQILCSSASKIDFLQFYADLMKRMQSVLSRSVARPPTLQSFETRDCKEEYTKALEPILDISSAWYPSREMREGSGSASYKGRSGSGFGSSGVGFPGVLGKYQIMVDLAGAFGEHFAKIEEPLREMTAEISHLSRRVQETQRDLTLRRCLIKSERIEELIKSCTTVDSRLGMHSAFMSDMQPDLQSLWQEQLDRVHRQQIIYREKMDNCLQLRETARQVVTAAKQLAPFAACIENMSALIDPRRCHPPDPAPMESICLQISTIEPDSERRIQAIEEEEQNRRLVQEAKRKEEVAERGTMVQKLHKSKNQKKSHVARLLVNTNRERSPGGTDSALTNPSGKQRNSPSFREDFSSDIDSFVDENSEFQRESTFATCEEMGSSFTVNDIEMEVTEQNGDHGGTIDEKNRNYESHLVEQASVTSTENEEFSDAVERQLKELGSSSYVTSKQWESTIDTRLSLPLEVSTTHTMILPKSAYSDDYVRTNWVTDIQMDKAQSTPGLRSPSPSTMSTIEQFLLDAGQEQQASPSSGTSPVPPTLSMNDSSLISCLLGRKEDEKEPFVRDSKRSSRGKLVRKPSTESNSSRPESLAGRITLDVGESRGNMLKSLQDVFSGRDQEDALVVIEQSNVLASAVKMAERRFKNTDREKGRRGKEKRKKSPVREQQSVERQSSEEQKSQNMERKPVPAPPHVPDSIFTGNVEKPLLGAFEARERLMESLRERVPKVDGTPEPEDTSTHTE